MPSDQDKRVTPNPALSGAIHDLQARLGSIRIAVTAVAGLDLDAETRNEMLTSASDESVRASAELAGIGALALWALDPSEPVACDLTAALRDAAETARLAGIDVEVSGEAATIQAKEARIPATLTALIRLVAGAGKHVRIACTVDGDEVRVAFERCGDDADSEVLPPVAGYLLDALGAIRESDATLTMRIGKAP